MKNKLYTIDDVLAILNGLIEKAGSISDLSARWQAQGHTGATGQIIGRIRAGKDAPTPAVLAAMGLQRVTLYKEKDDEK
jgi:hypothetical protein